MTEVVKIAPTTLELAVAKNSVSAVAIAVVDNNGGETTLAQIIEVLAANGMQTDEKKVYASVQTLATHGKVARGLNKGTYAPAGSVDQTARAAAKAAAITVKPERAARVGKAAVPARIYTNEEVFTDLITKLGDPVEFVVGKTWGATFVLLGDAGADHMTERATAALGSAPTSWTLTKVGPNDAVMLLA